MQIDLHEVNKLYNAGKSDEVHVLKDVTLSIQSGEVVCLQGPSGCGKTTLLSIMGCIFGPTSGSASIGGKNISRLPDHFLTRYRRELTGFIHQHYNLIGDLTVTENISLPLYPLGVSPDQQRKRADELMERLGIMHRKNFSVSMLSGGEQQRVAIARALVNNPSVILADEPTAHLDIELRKQFMQIVDTLKEAGKTVVMSSHDPWIGRSKVVDRIFSFDEGTIKPDVSRQPEKG